MLDPGSWAHSNVAVLPCGVVQGLPPDMEITQIAEDLRGMWSRGGRGGRCCVCVRRGESCAVCGGLASWLGGLLAPTAPPSDITTTTTEQPPSPMPMP